MRLAALLLAVAIPAVAAGAAAAPTAQLENPQSVVDELLTADRAYAEASAGAELADGIAAMFDSDTVMPVPGGFARGKDAIVTALKGNPANIGARATWTPVRGGISADGQHGFTIGFMTITAEGKPDRRAKYVSYWIKRAEGWRVAVYKRTGRPDGESSLDVMAPSLPSRALPTATNPATLAAYRDSLDRAERSFSDDAQRIGLAPAFVKHGSPDATNIGSGPGFTVGNKAIGADVGAGVGAGNGPGIHWGPAEDGVIVAATGDFGITWGVIKPNGPPPEGRPAESPYTTIWRRATPQTPWRYIAE